MAYKLIWSPAARDDLHDIVVFIVSMTAKENVLQTIRAFAERLLARALPQKSVYALLCEKTSGNDFWGKAARKRSLPSARHSVHWAR